MNPILFAVLAIVIAFAMVTSALIIWADLKLRKTFGFPAVLGFLMLGANIPNVALLILDINAPGLYTHALTAPRTLSVEHVIFLPGSFAQSAEWRVDTDQGTFLVDRKALVPLNGSVELVTRHHAWGRSTREFLCASASHCWPVLESNQ